MPEYFDKFRSRELARNAADADADVPGQSSAPVSPLPSPRHVHTRAILAVQTRPANLPSLMRSKLGDSEPGRPDIRVLQAARHGRTLADRLGANCLRDEGYFTHSLSGTPCRPGQFIVPAYESDNCPV